MSEVKIENLTDLCRICLGKTENMHSMSEIDPHTIDLLTFSLNFKVRETFTTLTSFCAKCAEKLENFAGLIRVARETQENLENLLKNEDTIDEEPAELNCDETRRTETAKKVTEFTYDDVMVSIKRAEAVSYENLKCFRCEFAGINIKALISHVSIAHPDSKERWCPICNDLFDDLRQHRTEHGTGDLTCRFCFKTFTINKYLVQHLLRHTNTIKPKKNQAEGEKKRGENAGDCKLCSVCGKQFSNVSRLLVHLRSHSDEAPFACAVCNKRLKTRSHLRQHENVHREFRPYLCNMCHKSFSQSSTLRNHLKLHGEKDKRCTVCDKAFCRISDLRVHLRTHTGEKPYRCRSCDAAFVQRSHLTEHEKRHMDVKPYKCLYCEKGFTQRSALKSHIDIHLGVKSYQCNFCPYAARQSYVLKTHMKQHEREFVSAEEI